VGLDVQYLDLMKARMHGRGLVVRGGRIAYAWGDVQSRGDVWSACKPVMTHFLFTALQEGRISSLDERAYLYEARLGDINAGLDYKDRMISLRHLANQISCYGVVEQPGSAFDYDDWQMALFIDILFLRIFDLPYEQWDTSILHPKLTDILQCQDDPTLLAYGPAYRQGRLGISLRDFARFGLMYLNQGNWVGRQVLDERYAHLAVTRPVPNEVPRAGFVTAEMIPGQRSLGSERIPDNQGEHFGSYSWCWWINGIDARGSRFLSEAPNDTFCALGDENDRRGMAIIPSKDIVFAWNDTALDVYPVSPRPLNECLRLLMAAAG
jgi:hypothetical protein